jgi:N-acetylneuraminic acid mutarotase
VRRTRWRLPQPLGREAVVAQGPGAPVVVAGGLLAGDTSSSASYTLDLSDGHVTRLPRLPVDVHDTAGVRLGGRTLVLGGGNASEQAVVQARRSGRWRVVGRLPAARSDLAAVVAGRRAYVVGGYDGGSPALGDVLASRDGRSWRVAAHLPLPVRYAATVLVGGALWVFGGERNGAMVDAVQRIDVGTGRAEVIGHLPRPVGHAAAVVLGGRVLLAGGRTGPDTVTDRTWWFSPATGRFMGAGRLPTGLADTAPVAAGPDAAYLVGGETPALTDRVVRLTLH